MEKFFKDVPMKKLGIINFIIGILTGFPVMLGVIYLFGTSNILNAILMFSISLLVIIFANFMLYKKNNNEDCNKNVYVTMVATFSMLMAGMFVSTEFFTLFMKISF